MATLEEMTSWSADDIHAAIVSEAPPGVSFRVIPNDDNRTHTVEYVDAEGVVLWSATRVDYELQLLLFDAYGWIWLKSHQSQHPMWAPRSALHELRRPIGRVTRPMDVADPEDMDPDELNAVYDQATRTSK